MRILRHYRDFPADLRGAVLAIGNFDGVHLGHQRVISAAADQARRDGRGFGVVTFEPHPREFFQPDLPPFRLTPFRTKMRVLSDQGCALAVSLPFDAALAALSAEQFVEQVLVAGLGISHAVVGYDFVFGHGRSGDAALLARMGEKLGFGVTVVPAAEADGAIVSSTEIRRRLSSADPEGAARLLGRTFEVEARVERGDQRGRTIGFPTANLSMGRYLRPTFGVYAVRNGLAAPDGQVTWYDGVANLGMRPTVGGADLRLEAHLFNFSDDIYGQELRVELIAFIRAERRFSGLDELKGQIALDAESARALLSRAR